MGRPSVHDGPEALLNRVRAALDQRPEIGAVELREQIRGTQSRVSAALRAARVERGLVRLADGESLDPEFAALVRMPASPPPLDLRGTLPPDLTRGIDEALQAARSAFGRAVDAIQQAAVAQIDAAGVAAEEHVADAEARTRRSEEFNRELLREQAEATAELERVRAEAATDRERHLANIAELRRGLELAQAEQQRADEARDAALQERRSAREALEASREHAMKLDRGLAVAGARVQEFERQVADLAARLTQATAETSAARAAERDARAAAAGAETLAAAHQETIRRLERMLDDLQSRGTTEEADAPSSGARCS